MIIKKTFATFIFLGIALFIVMFIVSVGFTGFHRSKERTKLVYIQMDLASVKSSYEHYIKEHLQGNLVDFSTYRKSYYYPWKDTVSIPGVRIHKLLDSQTGDITLLDFDSTIHLKLNKSLSTLDDTFIRYSIMIPTFLLEEQNKSLLENYTMKVEDKIELLFKIQNNINYSVDNKKKKIDIIEISLPQTKQELNEYLSWISKIEGYDTPDELVDVYGTQIEFKLTADGLEAVSAGRDKIFDTKDDQSYLSRYDEVEIYNKVTRPQLL